MQLSKFFAPFVKSTSNFEHFEKNVLPKLGKYAKDVFR